MKHPYCLSCPAWQDLSGDLDLTFIEDIVTYFRRVLQARAYREEEEKVRRKTERDEEPKKRKKSGARPDKRGREKEGRAETHWLLHNLQC